VISKENSQLTGKHKKHTDLTRPAFGMYNRNEWSLVGAPCSTIKLLTDQIINGLSPVYKCAYVDTTHDDNALAPEKLLNGGILEYTNFINYQQLNYSAPFNSFQLRDMFAIADMVLVNGNHQQAKAQVVIIDSKKKASLQKRLGQLNNVQMILLADHETEIFDFLKIAIPDWSRIPVYTLDETDKIIAFFVAQMQHSKPLINGLVLAGGKSERMGFDKGAVQWHGKEQRYYIADLLKNFCDDVYISCRPDQQTEIDPAYNKLPDTFTGLGPFGAILSAFREKPDHAWLVIACDLPLIEDSTLQHLIDSRKVSAIATAYKSAFDNFPEPLITIWEPKSYTVLLSFLAQGYSCPRKVLINSDIALLDAPNPEALTNVNTPEELNKIKQMLYQKTV
jgi:molybdenum cofactor guanylyltransferase